jgi:hypothetical protein
MASNKENAAASIHRRLLNGAKERGEDFQLTLVRYGSERLLYRLAQSFADRFVLKGALLLLLWEDQLYRPTRDIDLEGFGSTDPEHLATVFRAVCDQPCPEDALRFDADSVNATEIRTAQEYGGVRVTMTCFLGKARIPLQIDIGFGDAITPAPTVRPFPTLLDLPAPNLRTYPLETVVAEKFEAMARLGLGNSRMKDFRDLLTLASRQDFDGALLATAARATFANREARVEDIDTVLTDEFFADSVLQTRWHAYRRSQPRADDLPESLAEVGATILPFLAKLGAALRGTDLRLHWTAGHGWK